MPPLLDTPASRLIYHDLSAELTAALKTVDETGWHAISASLLESTQGFPDTTLLTALFLSDHHCAKNTDQFLGLKGTDDDPEASNRAYVTFGTRKGREACVEADPEHTMTLFYRDAFCRAGRNEYEEFVVHAPTEWEPRCIVALIEAESRVKLRDELLAAGRRLTEPLHLVLNYTTTLSPTPDYTISSANCAYGHLLKELHAQDTVGQDARDALQYAIESLNTARIQRDLFRGTMMSLSAFRPPNAPPPPSLPPSPSNAPPAAPAEVPFAVRMNQLEVRVTELEAEVETRNAAIQTCHPSETVTCGRSSLLAPNPWISESGEPCLGHSTGEAFEGSFCGLWTSHLNADAADAAEQAELLSEDGAPWCYSASTPVRILKCAYTADRTIRSGVYELQEWLRPDRPQYCESDVFRRLMLDNKTSTIGECRKTLEERLHTCHTESCPQCVSPCIYPTARVVGNVLKCVRPDQHSAYISFVHTSDAGQLSRSMHGARRKDNYEAIPEKLFAHNYHIGHANHDGLVQRDSVSCRKTHRNSPVPHITPGFDDQGSPQSRSGYMVPCQKNSDCLGCGRHKLTGAHYVCQRRRKFYDTVRTNDDGTIVFLNVTGGEGGIFDVDPGQGVCVDWDSSYNENCDNKAVANIKDAALGCFDGFVGKFLCGYSLDVLRGDPSTVQLTGNDWYPRVLVEGSEGVRRVECTDPIDCQNKCRYLERTSRDGMGAPPTCALCDQSCPSNFASTALGLVQAIMDDVLTVVRLLAHCFGSHGLAGCICQLALTLQPEWRKVSTNPTVRCENGDPMGLVVEAVLKELGKTAENVVNVFGDAFNNLLGGIGIQVPRLCVPETNHPLKCELPARLWNNVQAHYRYCENPQLAGGLDNLCHYQRVATICGNEEFLSEYTKLFASGYQDLDSLEGQFASAFGDSYEYLDPTLARLMEQAQLSQTSGPDLTERREICSTESFASAMTLDMIIASCVFEVLEGFCPDKATEDEEFAFTIETTSFKLPTVRFEWDVSPPPPPPTHLSAYQTLMDADPHGFARVRNKLDDLFPTLAHVATSSMGAYVGPHPPEFDMPSAAITRAFLASAYMERDSLGARVIESKHTGRWRPACSELFKYLNENTSPGQKSAGYTSGREVPDVEHTGDWDRNMFLAAMLEIEFSFTGSHRLSDQAFSPLALYDEICGYGNLNGDGPAGWRVAHETYTRSQRDWLVLASSPAYARAVGTVNFSPSGVITETDVAAFAPIIGYGSLETLRSMRASEMHTCQNGFAPEDPEISMVCQQGDTSLAASLENRAGHSPFSIQRDVWCNPSVSLSTESLIGNPLQHPGHLYDTPIKHDYHLHSWRVAQYDRGEEFIDATYKQQNLMSWVYVTSSGDDRVRAGMYRLRDLPAFRPTQCDQLPDVRCSYQGATVESVRNNAIFSVLFGRNWITTAPPEQRLNLGVALSDDIGNGAQPGQSFMSGREAVVRVRCSDALDGYFAASAGGSLVPSCTRTPYANHAACNNINDLALTSQPTVYGPDFFYSRLGPAPSPPSPPPPPSPSPPKPPPSPSPSPSSPIQQTQLEVMEDIRGIEERMCTSVYYLSQETRCNRLALELTRRVTMSFLSPPSPPPATPISPAVPPPPPTPSLPNGLTTLPLLGARLSTLRYPAQLPENTPYDADGYYGWRGDTDKTVLTNQLANASIDQRACVPNAPLACATGVLRDECMNDDRRCHTIDDPSMNSHDPHVRVRFRVPEQQYLWAVEFVLPSNGQLAKLMNGPAKLEVFGPRHTPVPCAESDKSIGYPMPQSVTFYCDGGATDAERVLLSQVSEIKLTLRGMYRQVWLSQIMPITRSLDAAGISPSRAAALRGPGSGPEGGLPPPPPPPPPPPVGSCTFFPGVHFTGDLASIGVYFPPASYIGEPCGLDATQCCHHAIENGMTGFAIDDSGCCDLFKNAHQQWIPNSTIAPQNGWSERAGLGVVVSVA